jgi:HupE / UreJ protein
MSLRRLTSTIRVAALLVAVCICVSLPADAHTKSETYTVWHISGPAARATYSIPLVEADRLAKGGGRASNDEVSTYLASHVSVASKAGQCPIAGPVRAVAATEQFRRFELAFQCTSAEDLELHSDAFFELVPSHVTLAQIETDKGDLIEQMITADQRTLSLSGGEAEVMRSASFLDYMKMGVMHIFTGVDHMSFLLGLVLISRRMRDLAFVITGFTLGHSATLALAVTGILRPHAEYIDALVALTIALIGAENIAVATRKPEVISIGVVSLLTVMAVASAAGFGSLPAALLAGAALFASSYLMMSGHLYDAARLRLVVTLVFGLIHGFGFATDLLEMRLPTERLVELLVGFNLGVEVGQLTLVFSLLGIVAVLARARITLPRPIVVDVLSSGLVALGMYWFISRSYL